MTRFLGRNQVFFEYRSSPQKIGYDDRMTWQKPIMLVLNEIWDYMNKWNALVQYSEGFLGRRNIYSLNQKVCKELIINAVIHQDWRLTGQVDIRLSSDFIHVTSPGGFPPGVNTENLISVRSTPRNQRLADVADKINLMERSGQ